MDVLRFFNMAQTLAERVRDLEKRVARLSIQAARATRQKNPWRTYGVFKDDPYHERAVKLGRKYRQQQTYKKEIAAA
jgi:hypothetical protein